MQKQGFTGTKKLATWREEMKRIFPDVKKGKNITGILSSSGETLFYYEEKLIGTVKDPLFGKQFFAIWLSTKTSEPALRKALLGL
jgi:hypothetical protein